MKRKFLILGIVILSVVAMLLGACAGPTTDPRKVRIDSAGARGFDNPQKLTDAQQQRILEIILNTNEAREHPPTKSIYDTRLLWTAFIWDNSGYSYMSSVPFENWEADPSYKAISESARWYPGAVIRFGDPPNKSTYWFIQANVDLEANKVVYISSMPYGGELLTAPTPTTSPTATQAASAGIAEFRATDAPPTGISKILVTTKDIQVHKANAANDSWITVVSAEKTFDLVAIQGAELSLGQETLSPGTYTQIRLDVTKVVVTKDGKDITAKLPSDKLKIVTPFEIKTGEKTILTLDFEADKFVVMTGADTALVKPVIRLGITQGDRPLRVKGEGQSPTAGTATVTGNVTYLENIALDPAAVISVKLVDVSRQDAPVVVGQQAIIAGENQVPFSFEINYNATSIKASNTYSIQADITLNGQKIFTSDKDYLVITKGNPSTIEITLKKS